MNFALLLWHIDGIMGFRKIKLNHRLDEIFLSNITQKKIWPLFFRNFKIFNFSNLGIRMQKKRNLHLYF